ncbi:MAG: prepilin-type N-terminal cleavage/methylation domain-containing protein [Gemmatimonadetes bacterium]|nr:prepilin-type N-terminal cleavage/methylation domain-containing protein [Gemmatimonadota bacterium]
MTMTRDKSGFTLIELLIVIVLIGAMAGFAFPRIGDAITQQSVRSARGAVVGLVAKARGTAIQRGSTTRLIVRNNVLYVEAANPVTGVNQQVGVAENFTTRYGVTVQPSHDTLWFDARGIGIESAETAIVVTKGSFAEKVVISLVGRVIQ